MPTDTEIWERACERVGLWKRGQVCKGCFFTPHESKEAVRNARWENGTAHHVDHDIPAPALGDPAVVVAMLEWLLSEPRSMIELGRPYVAHTPSEFYCAIEDRPGGWGATSALALANAVLAVPQETQP